MNNVIEKIKNTIAFVGDLGFLLDLSLVERRGGVDASRWAGVVRIGLGDTIVTTNWKGAEGAADGMLFDAEGEDESACEIVDSLVSEISEIVAKRLGDPCSPEERRELARRGWYDAA